MVQNAHNKLNASMSELQDALILSAEIIGDIELSRNTLTRVTLKASRLARLLGDPFYQSFFQLEASGYPKLLSELSYDYRPLLRKNGRLVMHTYSDGRTEELLWIVPIEMLEINLESAKINLQAANDPPMSVSSSNPNQYVFPTPGNAAERKRLRDEIEKNTKLLSKIRSVVYEYCSDKNHLLQYSGLASDAFSRIRRSADDAICRILPRSVDKFAAVYSNLTSENPEDWANAVHSCRRILQDLADFVYPPTSQPLQRIDNGKPKNIKLGPDQYINRLVAFVESKTNSGSFKGVVGSQLSYIGDRLDSVFQAAQKGSHAEIPSREEADRYVVYTYLIVADILSLSVAV